MSGERREYNITSIFIVHCPLSMLFQILNSTAVHCPLFILFIYCPLSYAVVKSSPMLVSTQYVRGFILGRGFVPVPSSFAVKSLGLGVRELKF